MWVGAAVDAKLRGPFSGEDALGSGHAWPIRHVGGDNPSAVRRFPNGRCLCAASFAPFPC